MSSEESEWTVVRNRKKKQTDAKPNYLLIHMNQVKGSNKPPKFEHFKRIGYFKIDMEQKYIGGEGEPNIPRLIASSSISELKGSSLSVGFSEAVQIPDYDRYTEMKMKHFLDWISNTNYFKKVQERVSYFA